VILIDDGIATGLSRDLCFEESTLNTRGD